LLSALQQKGDRQKKRVAPVVLTLAVLFQVIAPRSYQMFLFLEWSSEWHPVFWVSGYRNATGDKKRKERIIHWIGKKN
jgi:hypothetical protein